MKKPAIVLIVILATIFSCATPHVPKTSPAGNTPPIAPADTAKFHRDGARI